MIYNPEAPGQAMPLQDASGPKGTVPPPSGDATSGYKLAAPQYAPSVGPPPPSNSDTAAPATGGGAAAPAVAPGDSFTPPSSMSPPTGGPNPTPLIPPPPGGFDFAAQPSTPGYPQMPGVGIQMPSPSVAPPPPGGTALTGNEAPYRIDPTQSGAVTSLQDRLQQEALRQLDNPTIWDDQLAKAAADMGKRGINENYAAAQEGLNSELADRGINFSTIAGGRNLDLATRRAQQLSDVDTDIMRERANAIAQGRSAAFSNTRGIMGDRASLEAGQRAEQRGERTYVDDTRNRARDEALQAAQLEAGYDSQNDAAYENFLQSIYGYGSSTAGAGLLGDAAGSYGSAAGEYGQQAEGDENDMGALAQYALQYLYGGQGQQQQEDY